MATESSDDITGETTNACGCSNGGTCTIVEDQLICECPVGFEGDRCEETFIDFSYGSKPETSIDPALTIGIAVSCLVLVVLVIGGFLTWRRFTNIREKKRWVKWQESRRQSKATIEGFTIVEPTPVQSKSRPTVGIQLFKNINCNKIFSFQEDPSPKDVESQTGGREPVWIATICTERQSSLPAHSCTSSDSQISIVLNNDRVSFLSYSPSFAKDGSVQTAMTSLSTIDKVSCDGSVTHQHSKGESDGACKASKASDSCANEADTTAKCQEDQGGDKFPENESDRKENEKNALRALHQTSLRSENNNRAGRRRLSFAIPPHDVIET